MDIVPVMVSYELFSRQQKMDVFRRHFLGTTRAGKSCTILNEDDIQLIYNVKDNTLQAFCNTPILIYNKYLQYSLEYHLQEFLIQYDRQSIKDRHMLRFRIDGSCIFNDMAPQNPNIAKRRALIYQRSATAFFYDLIHKDLDNDATFSSVFQVYRYDFEPLKIKETHHLKDSLNMHVVTLTFPPELIEDDTRPPSSLPIYGRMLVRYKDLALSGIIYHQSSFLLDDFGNFGSNSGIYFEGDMSLQGIGNRPIIARTPTLNGSFSAKEPTNFCCNRLSEASANDSPSKPPQI